MESSFNFLGFKNALNREGQTDEITYRFLQHDGLYNRTFNRSKSKNCITFYSFKCNKRVVISIVCVWGGGGGFYKIVGAEISLREQ